MWKCKTCMALNECALSAHKSNIPQSLCPSDTMNRQSVNSTQDWFNFIDFYRVMSTVELNLLTTPQPCDSNYTLKVKHEHESWAQAKFFRLSYMACNIFKNNTNIWFTPKCDAFSVLQFWYNIVDSFLKMPCHLPEH